MPKDPPAPPAQESMASIMRTFYKAYPYLIKANAAGILPTELAKISALEQTAPRETALLGEVNRANLGQDIQTLQATSPAYISGIRSAEEQLNPGSTGLRDSATQAYQGGIESLDPNKIFPEAERLVNLENVRSGNMSSPASGTTTIANALRFGEAKTNRMMQLNNLLQGSTNFLNNGTLKADYLGRPTSTQQTGTSFANVGSGAEGLTSGLLNTTSQIKGQEIDINANRRSGLEVGLGSMPSYS